MKTILRIILIVNLALACCAMAAVGQQPSTASSKPGAAAATTTPASVAPPTLTELQRARITIALKDFQIAQMQANAAQTAQNQAQQQAVAVIAAVKSELGLGDDWDINLQTMQAVRKPEAVAPKPAAAAPSTPTPVPAAKK